MGPDEGDGVRDRLALILRWSAVAVAAAGLLGVRAVRQPGADEPDAPIEVAITVDDLSRPAFQGDDEPAAPVIEKLVTAFAAHHLPPVTGFLNGLQLRQHPADRAAVERWLAAGNLLGNHTYSHLDLARVSLPEFYADLERNEPLLNRLQGVPRPGRDWRVFRFPYLQEGASQETREEVRQHLFAKGYRIAEVTVDFEDWQWFGTFERCAATHDERAVSALRARYRRAARDSLLEADRLSRNLFGRRIRQVLLLHAGTFSAEMIEDLLDEYEGMGVRFVSLDDALQDSAYHLDPRFARNWGSPFLYQVQSALHGDDPNAKWPPYPEFASLCR